MEGYGQTETTALATATWLGDNVAGHTGGPGVCSLLKLEDVPDMGYFAVGRVRKWDWSLKIEVRARNLLFPKNRV